MTVHSSEDIAIKIKVLQGWRDKSDLWQVPIKYKVENDNTDNPLIGHPAPKDAIQNVYELASTEKTMRYLHAALGFSHQVHMAEIYS